MLPNAAYSIPNANPTRQTRLGTTFAVAVYLLALVASVAGFVLSYWAAGLGLAIALGIAYLSGAVAAILIIGLSLCVKTKAKTGILRFLTTK